MKYIKEKIAYLKGFSDGMKLSEKSDEGKALLKVLEILDDITDALDGLALAQSETEDRLEDMSDDIEFLEEYVYDFDDDDDFDDEDDELYEVTCPKCGESYFVDYDDFDEGDVFCPFCGEDFELDDETVAKLMAAENGDPCACCHCEAAEDEDIPF